jgi:hypothetical protein
MFFLFIELPRSYILSNMSVELPGLTQIFFLNVFFYEIDFFLISSFGIKLLAIELSDFFFFMLVYPECELVNLTWVSLAYIF